MTALVAPHPRDTARSLTSQGAAGPSRQRKRLAGLLLVLLGANLGAALSLGLARLPVDLAVAGGLATWGGRMTGLLAEVLILAMVLLAARVPWLERAVGQDRLLAWHRWIAPTALVALVAHPLLLALGYSAAVRGWWNSLLALGGTTLDAVAGTAIFLVAAAASVHVVRRRLPYEGWHLLHLTTYAAVLLAFAHQLSAGSTVLHGTLVRGWWTAQLVLVLAVAVLFRVVLPLWHSARHDLRVVAVRRDSADVITVTIAGRDVAGLGAVGGQFLVWRFLDATHWWRAHPFSLSAAPADGRLRLTARELGDGTRAMTGLRPGTRVWVEGPYGVLTADSRTRNGVLLIGAGLGIAPIRALLEELPADVDTVLVQRAADRSDAVLHEEIIDLAAARPRTRAHLVTGPRGRAGEPYRPLGARHLHELAPDITARDVFVCGPPGLTSDLRRTLQELGVPAGQIHFESFNL